MLHFGTVVVLDNQCIEGLCLAEFVSHSEVVTKAAIN